MTCDFGCENNHVQEIKFSIHDGPPKEIFCNVCKKLMKRIWKANIQIPEWFNDDTHTTIHNKMTHAPRPTGKTKTLY